ncbi:MAG: efflux RND transporter periplasmic adaptor subunit [Thermodesulfobacteriota bacterium]|nr:efflux RND transporter periplasmic adaptor subunit [Thermodesulfobacteriota bacterium]
MKKKVGLFFMIISFLFSVSCNRDKSQHVLEKEKSTRIVPVEAMNVKKGDIVSYLSVTGTIYPFQEANIGPRISGRIKRLFADEGDYIDENQKLIMLEQKSLIIAHQQAEAALETARASLERLLAGTREEEVKRAEAAFAMAEANLNNARLEFNRYKKLYEKHTVAKKAYDTASTQYKVALAGLEKAREGLRMARKGPTKEDIQVAQSQVKQAEVNVKMAKQTLEDSVTKAPFSGFIVRKFKNEGECVTATPATSVLKIADISKVKVEVKIPENEIGRIRKDNRAEVRVDAFPEKSFIGKVVMVNPSVDPVSRTFKTKIEISNKEGLLKGGMFARVHIAVDVHRGVIIISRDAIIEAGDYKFAFVINSGVAHKKRIVTGLNQDDNIEVKSGLNEGEVVVIAGQYDLKDGTSVKIVKGEMKTAEQDY